MCIEDKILFILIFILAFIYIFWFVLLMFFMKRYYDISQKYFKLQRDVLKMSGIPNPLRIRITGEVIENTED